MLTTQMALNRLADQATDVYTIQEAMNILAETSGLSTQEAANAPTYC